MRLLLAVLVLLTALPTAASAQSRGRGRSSASSSNLPPMLGPIGLPLPPIGLGLPRIGFPPPESPAPRGRFGRSNFTFGHEGGRFLRRAPTIVYFLPTYDYPYSYESYPYPISSFPYPLEELSERGTMTFEPHVPPVSDAVPRLSGTLRMEVKPAGPHPAYIDGAYVGTLDDYNSELNLEPGRHSVEIRGPGFEPLTFDVSIQAGRSITYRGALKAAAGDAAREVREAAPAEALPPTVIYFIPGCYLGNVPPAQVKLPAKCDLSQLITTKP